MSASWDGMGMTGGRGRHGGEESSQSTVPATLEEAATTGSEPSLAFTVGNWGTLAMVIGGFTEYGE